MLVLSRKKNQTILINDNISIEVLQIKGNTIRLGIQAPGSVRILRGELKPFGMEEDSTDPMAAGEQASMGPGGSVPICETATEFTQIAQAS